MLRIIHLIIISILLFSCSAQKVSIIKEKKTDIFIFDLPSYQVATKDDRYGVISLSLHHSSVEVQNELSARRGTCNKNISKILNSKKYADFSTQEKQNKLRTEIKQAVNNFLIKGKIKEVKIRELVIN